MQSTHDFSLKLDTRTLSGKKATELRQTGLVPSVIYEGHKDTLLAQSPLVETTKLVHSAGKHSPVHLTLDGKKHLAMIKTIDYDPIKHVVRHVAFHAIKQNEVITAEVPITLVGLGESAAEKAGLVILQAIEHVEVKAKPADLPEALELSVAELATDEDKLTFADITLPEGVEYADVEQDQELVIANVYEPAALEAANEAAAGDATIDEEPTAENGAEEAPADSEVEKSE
jgi:large subunit ribosomal protein L25